MALDPRTKKIQRDWEEMFGESKKEKSKFDFSGFENITPGKLESSQPVPTDYEYGDFDRFIEGPIDPVYKDIEEQAAQAQSVAERAAKGIGRIGTKIAFEVAKMPGELYGLGEFGVRYLQGEGVGAFADAVNNEWVQSISKAEEELNENGLKIYVPNSVREGNLWDNITSSSFWATEGADGIGFLLSMFIPGQALKAAKLGTGVTKLGKIGGYPAKILKPGTKAGARVAGKIDDFAAASVNTLFESASEGIETAKAIEDHYYQDIYKGLIENGVPEEEARARAEAGSQTEGVKAMAGEAGWGTFTKNLAILIGPNIMDQKWLFNGFKKSSKGVAEIIERRAGKAIGSTADDAFEGITRLTPKQRWGRAGEKFGLGVAKEGFFEEGFQFAASELEKQKVVNPEEATNLLDVYAEGLSTTDMQKSIFLGAMLGGVMGGIGGFNSAKREDEYLFGREAKEREGIAKALGLRDVEERKGVIEIFKDNFIKRYLTVNDILNKDEDGNLILDEEGNTSVDLEKLKRFGIELLTDTRNREILNQMVLNNDKEGYEYLKSQMDLNYMMPYMREEGGYEILKTHINALAERELKTLQETGMYQDVDLEDIRTDLLQKAEKVKRIYDKAERQPLDLFTAKDNKEYRRQFSNHLFDKFISLEYETDYLRNKANEFSGKVAENLGKDIRYEDPVKYTQIKKGVLLNVNGDTVQVLGRSGKEVRVRDVTGQEKTLTTDQILEEGNQLVQGLSPLDRNQLFEDLEQLDTYNKDTKTKEEALEKLSTKKGQQEQFDEFVQTLKKGKKQTDKLKDQKTEEDLNKAKTVEDVNKTVKDQPTEKDKEKANKKSEQISKQERKKKDIPKEDPTETKDSDILPTEDPATEPEVDINKLLDIVEDYYKDMPHSKRLDMRKLFGNPEGKTEKAKDGEILSAIKEASEKQEGLFDDEGRMVTDEEIPSEFVSVKNIYDEVDEKDPVFIDFLQRFAKGEVIQDENERAIIKSVLGDHYSEVEQEAAAAVATTKTEPPAPKTTNKKDEAYSVENLEKEDAGFLDDFNPYGDQEGDGDISVFSHDHVFREVKIPKNQKGKTQAWILERKDGKPINYKPSVMSDEDYRRWKRGRQLINSGKISDDTKVRFRVNKKSPYNAHERYTRNFADFQIEIVTDYKGKEVLLGYMPAMKERNGYMQNGNTFDLRKAIWQEVQDSKKDVITSSYESNITFFRSGKIFRTNDTISPSQVKGETYLSVVVAKNEKNKEHRTNETDVDFTQGVSADHLQSGAVYVWVKHPANDTWYPVRAFTKTLDKLPKLKKEVIRKLKTIDSTEKAKEVLADIKDNEAILDFRYNPEDNTIIPREREKGKWVERIALPAFNLDNIDDSAIAERWLNDITAQINKNFVNLKDYNQQVDERLELNTTPEVFSDINFTIDKTPFKPSEEVDKAKESDPEPPSVVQKDDTGQEKKLPKEKDLPIERKTKKLIPDEKLKRRKRPKARVVTSSRYIKWNREQETQWFNERFPDIPFYVHKNLRETLSYGRNLWGAFTNASVYIAENAAEGTVYHEAFHVVFNMFLTEREQNDLTKSLTEEQLADKFMEYVQGRQDRTLGRKILDFFKNLWSYIQYVATGEVNSDLIFRRIDNKFYKNEPFTKDVSEFKSDEYNRYRAASVPGKWTRRDVILQARAINAHLLKDILPKIRKYNEDLQKLDDVELIQALGDNTVQGAMVAYDQVFQELKNSRQDYVEDENTTEDEIALFDDLLESMNDDLNNGKPKSGGIIAEAMRDLNNYDIKVTGPGFRMQSEEQEDLQENTDEIGYAESWQVEAAQRNSKNAISYEVKRYIRNMVRVNKEGETLADPIGLLDAPVDYDLFYDTIMKDVSGEDNVGDMITILESLTDFRPEYKRLASTLRNDREFATKFFNSFNKPELIQIFVSELFQGKNKISDMVVSLSNRKGVQQRIIRDWSNGTEEANLLKEHDKAQKAFDDISEYQNKYIKIDKKKSKEIARILTNVGMSIPQDFMYNLYEAEGRSATNNTIGKFKTLISAFIPKENPKTGKMEQKDPFTDEGKENNALVYLSKALKVSAESITQPSFNNVENKKTYAHLEGNYMVRLINNLTKNDDSMMTKMEALLQDPMYADGLVILKELFNANTGKRAKIRNILQYAVLDGLRFANESQGTKFADMDETSLNVTTLALFMNNGNKDEAWFRLFTISDAPIMPLIKYSRKGVEQDQFGLSVLDSMVTVARAEIDKIKRIQQRLESLPDNQKIKNYDTELNASFKTGFKLIPFLNGAKVAGKNIENLDLSDINSSDWMSLKNFIKKNMDQKAENYTKKLEDQGIIKKEKEGYSAVSGMFPGKALTGQNPLYKNVEEAVRSFFYNDYFMRTQSTLLSSGDPGFYKMDDNGNSVVDLQKRAKEVHSPRSLLDTTAEWNGEKIKSDYRGILLKDNEFYSNNADAIYNALKNSGVEEREALQIAAQYGYFNDTIKDKKGNDVPIARVDKDTYFRARKVNQTDAQAYITLDFYKHTMIGAGRWNQKMEDMYQRLKKGKGTSEDIQAILQPFKPFHYDIRTITQEVNGEQQTINVPTQHKNSEYVLIPQLVEQADQNLKDLYSRMQSDNIDIVNFDSAGKVGNYGVAAATSPKDAVIHTYAMRSRGIQQEVPEHFIDTTNLYGSQIRALIMSNLVEGEDYVINSDGETALTRKGEEAYKLYNELLVANIRESSERLKKDFGINEFTLKEENKSKIKEINNKKISQEEKDNQIQDVLDYARLSKIRDLLVAEIQDRGKGEQYEKAVQIVRRNNKWTFALPLFHPVHSTNVESLINSVFKNRITKQKINGGAFVQVSNFGFTNKLNLKFKEDGGLDHAEIMLPKWSQELFKPYTNSDGTVRMEEVPESLLKGVGYRIPTEDKYSMLPFKVVGFLPQEAGGVIMLPAEITTIAGSDFDIDKMFVMLPEGRTYYDYKGLSKEIQEKTGKKFDYKTLRAIHKGEESLLSDKPKMEAEVKKVIDKYIDNHYKSSKVNYDYKKDASKQERAARNNALIDITYGILQNKNTLKDFINPGGFNSLQRFSKVVQLLESGVTMEAIREAEANDNLDTLFNKKVSTEALDFMSADTQNTLAIRNMTGKQLVGIAANHNKNHAMRQATKIALKNGVKFNRQDLKSLHDSSDIEGGKITKNLAEFLAAVVDNAKDPIAAFINYNTQTADIISMIVSTGHSLDTALAFINQPVIKELVKELQNSPIAEETAILKRVARENGIKDIFKVKAVDLNTEDLLDNISSKEDSMNRDILASFFAYRRIAKDFATMIRAMRGDTQGGAPGPTFSENSRGINTLKKAMDSDNITGFREAVGDIINNPEQDSMDTEIPYLREFTARGLIDATDFLSNYFPNNKPAFVNIRESIQDTLDRDLTTKEIELINSSIITYLFSNQSFYKTANKEDFVKNFPVRFYRLSKQDPDFADNILVKMIEYNKKDRRVPIGYLSYDNSKEASNEQRKDIINNFRDLLSDERVISEELGITDAKKLENLGIDVNTTYADVANDLIRYSFFSSGFNFGPNSFFNLIPVEFYTEMEGKQLLSYTDTIMSEAENMTMFKNFEDQFYRNNYNKSNLVPVLKKDEKGNPSEFEIRKNEEDNYYLADPTAKKPSQYGENYQVKVKTPGGFVTKYKPYIKHSIDSNNNLLFKYNEETRVYEKVDKLGIPNILLEYDTDSPALTSVVNGIINKVDKKKIFKAQKGHRRDPDIKEKLFNNMDESNMVDVLGRIAYSDHALRDLAYKLWEEAKRVRDMGVEIPVRLITQEEYDSIFADRAPASYTSEGNYIVMTSDGLYRKNSETSFLHEVVHALSVYSLESDSQVAKDFREMFEYAKANTSNKSLYAYKDMFEFAAELYTNSGLIKDLKSMRPSKDVKKYNNLFEEIVARILEFLNITPSESAYEQATSILSNVIHYQYSELNQKAMAEAKQLERDYNLVSKSGQRYFKGYTQSGEIAKDLNENQLKNTNFEARRIKFTREVAGKPKEVWGVEIMPTDITPRVDTKQTDIMHETEMELAFKYISDQDAIEQQKICN